jgi:uncharacterized membrane protein YkvA (DUF1232 family)
MKTKEPDKEYIKKGAEKITDQDFEKVLERQDAIKKKFEVNGPLSRFIEDAKILFSLVRDYWDKKYRKIPYWAISAVVFSLLYVFSPVDLVPDFIPFLGFVDDGLIVALCLRMIETDLHKYKDWKIKNS